MRPNIVADDVMTESDRYRLLVESITDYAIYMLDPNGIIVSWNAGAERFTGYTRSEILGQHFSRFYTEEDLKKGMPERALAAAATEGRFEAEGWRVRKDATHYWTHIIVDPIRGTDGKLIGFAKITRDVSERKAAEAKLKSSEEQFRLLIQSVTDYAIYMLDPEGVIVSWNAGAERIKGYAPSEIIGQNFSRFYGKHEQEKGEPRRGLGIASEEGRFASEGWRYRKDGSRFWASVVIDSIRDERGILIGFAKITRDITEKKDAERALEETREKLFQSQKMEAVGQLTGGIAHDFNNLLMVILSTFELLRRRLPHEEKIETLLDNATRAAQRGVSLTKRMLAFSRRQELNREAIDLQRLVFEMRDLLERSLGPTIRIETRFPLTLPNILADANQLESALVNLAVNSRDAMPQGGPLAFAGREGRISPGQSTLLNPGKYVVISVEDKGEGMDRETLARASEPFFTTKGIGKGTGLGLSMVQGFAEQSGGALYLKSEKGAGTTAELWLPVAEAKDTVLPSKSKLVESLPEQVPQLVILAVDDDPLVLMNTAAMLEDLGHLVLTAGSGAAALRTLSEASNVSVVVTDQAMPRMTGLQLSEAIKAERPDLPIVLATGYSELPENAAGPLTKLSKPFNQQQLTSAINEALHAASADRGAA